MSIVITIPDTHPDYIALSKRVDHCDSVSAGFLTVEQHTDGIWTARYSIVSPRPSASRFNASLVQIAIEKPST